MAKLRLLIKRSGSTNTCIPVIVEESDIIGNCISSLVDHLGFPRRDGLGRALSYALHPLSGGQPFSNSWRFADAHLLPETRLVLEVDESNMATQEVGHPMKARYAAGGATGTTYSTALSHQLVDRRTFLLGSILTGCALSGLLSGVATVFATRRRALSLAASPPRMLRQSLLFSKHQQIVRAVSWSPDGSIVASGADDTLLLLWTPSGQVRQQIPHPTGVAALAWSPAGQYLASGFGISVRFFDGRTAAPLSPARSVHTGQVTNLAWSPASGHPLISGSEDMRAIVWETRDYHPQAIFTRHTAAIDALSCQPGNTTVASASRGGVVRVWRVDTLAELHGFYQDSQLPMHTVAFAPTGSQLAVGGDDGQVRLWSNGVVCQQASVTAQGTRCVDVPQRFRTHTAPVRTASWSPDGHYLATGGEDGALAIWTFSQGQEPSLLTIEQHDHPVLAVSWSPDNQRIAAASGNVVTIWALQA